MKPLISRGHAYRGADGSVYFRVASFADYGKLSHLEDRELKIGAAQSANDSDEYSKDALADFTGDVSTSSVSSLVVRSPRLVHFIPQQATDLVFHPWGDEMWARGAASIVLRRLYEAPWNNSE